MRAAKSISDKNDQIDPLFVIFEQHLYNFQDSEVDRKDFVAAVVKEYVVYLRKQNILIPKSLEEPVFEELGNQVSAMLTKKIYGFLTIADYQKKQPLQTRRRARTRYAKLKR